MKNIEGIHNCYGCAICAVACPKKIIEIECNDDGYYEPNIIKKKSCINCGLCVSLCPFLSTELASKNNDPIGYAGWSLDPVIRNISTSGGVIYEICKSSIQKGYKVIGTRYNIEKRKAEHILVEHLSDLKSTSGSKYIPSYTLEGFKELNRKEKFLVVGTPCQIDGVRRLIKKWNVENNFILIDFFCYGTPSMHVWNKYLDIIQKKIGPISKVSWRTKNYSAIDKIIVNPWHSSVAMYFLSSDNKFIFSKYSGKNQNLFYKFFFKYKCMGLQCHKECKYKKYNSSADIRCGDFWGPTYKENDLGVNAILAFTENGVNALNAANIHLDSHDKDIVTEGQQSKNISKPYWRKIIFSLLRTNLSLPTISKIVSFITLPFFLKQHFLRYWKKGLIILKKGAKL